MELQSSSSEHTPSITREQYEDFSHHQDELHDRFKKGLICTLASVALMPAWVYAHELGHLIAAKLLFTNISGRIVLDTYGYFGGSIDFGQRFLHLSQVGHLIGGAASHSAVYLAGPLVNISISILGAATAGRKHALLFFMPVWMMLLSVFVDACGNLEGNGDFAKLSQHAGFTAYMLAAGTVVSTVAFVFMKTFPSS
jgi:hypothetical protein